MRNSINLFNDDSSTYVYENDKNTHFGYSTMSHNNFISEINPNEYIISDSSNLNIFDRVWDKLDDISNNDIKRYICDIINTYQILLSSYILYSIDDSFQHSNYLPSILINENEDTSVVLELILTNSRIGITIEPNIDDSYWFFLLNKDNHISQSLEPFTRSKLSENLETIIKIAYDFT